MDKLISQQAAIDTLKELTANGTNKGMVFGEDAVHRIEILPPVQPEQRWIPCSERLPEDFQKVLVFWWEHSEPMIDTAFWQKDAKRFDGQHWVRIEDKITHWMPLPEPYEERRQDGQ